MSAIKTIGGHRVELGHCFDGYGKRVLVNGKDVTEHIRMELGKDTEDYVSDGNAFICSYIEKRFRSGTPHWVEQC